MPGLTMIALSSPRRVPGDDLLATLVARNLGLGRHQTFSPRVLILATAASTPIRSIVLMASVGSFSRTKRFSAANQ
jgi:hypothetical protein